VNITINDKFAILGILTTASAKLGCALDSSSASSALKEAGYGDLKRRFGAMKVSDVLREIPGITIKDAHYHGGRSTVIVDALAQADDGYSSSDHVEKTLANYQRRNGKVGDLDKALIEFMDMLSLILHDEWAQTLTEMEDAKSDSAISGTFLVPGVPDVDWNWSGRAAFIKCHDHLVDVMHQHGLHKIDPPLGYQAFWRGFHFPLSVSKGGSVPPCAEHSSHAH
jgi:hypothetical protein